MNPTTANYDEPWKEALSEYFEAFLCFFFPEVHQLIDWTKIPESLEKELKREIETWQKERNQTASTVIWMFTTSDARVNLKHLYPVFEEEESGESIAPN